MLIQDYNKQQNIGAIEEFEEKNKSKKNNLTVERKIVPIATVYNLCIYILREYLKENKKTTCYCFQYSRHADHVRPPRRIQTYACTKLYSDVWTIERKQYYTKLLEKSTL